MQIKSYRLFRFFSYLVLVLLLAHCSGVVQTAKKIKYPSEVDESMRAAFDQAEGFYLRHQYDEAYQAYQRYITSYGYNRLTDEAYYKQGKIFFLRRDFAGAAQRFQFLASQSPDPQYKAKGYHMSGYALYKNGDHAHAMENLQKVASDLLPPMLRMQYDSLIIFVAQATSQYADQANYAMLRLYDLYEEQGQSVQNLNAPDVVGYMQVKSMIENWVAQPMSSSSFPAWMKKYPSGPAKGFVEYKIARTYYEEKNPSKAKKLLTAFLNSYPKNYYASNASSMLKELGGPDQTLVAGENYRVGVLLPLSGAQTGFADAVLKGVRCGAGENGVCGGNSNIALVIRDAGFSPDMVRSAIDQLATENVTSIISILPGTLAVEAAVHAASKNLPLLMISQQEGLMRQGASVFQLGLSPERQIAELADIADSKGLKTFAIFYPNIPYGQKMAELFSSAIQNRGGKVVAKTAYNKQSTDLFSDVRRFKSDLDVTKMSNNGNASSEKPVDAIFIPDTYQSVNSIASALEVNQLTGTSLIGTNTWNDPGLSQGIGASFPGSFFVDLYDSSATGSEVQDFRQKFSSSFGSEPQVLNALGYDAMMMVRSAVSSEGVGKLQDSLAHGFGYKGVTGISGFKPGEAPIVHPKIITLKAYGENTSF